MSIIREAKNTHEVREMFSFADEILHCVSDHPRNADFYVKQFEAEPSFMLLAEENGAIVGVLMTSEKDEDTILLGELAVSPSFQGQGIGGSLLAEIELRGQNLGKKSIFLAAMGPAEGFYLKNGYTPKLFIQLEGNDRIDEIKALTDLPITWEETGSGYSKAIIETQKIDKDLQDKMWTLTGSHTQYLFTKNI